MTDTIDRTLPPPTLPRVHADDARRATDLGKLVLANGPTWGTLVKDGALINLYAFVINMTSASNSVCLKDGRASGLTSARSS